jgi:hypothetical protein
VSRDRWTRVLLAVLAGSALVVGAWATAAPRSFYDSFPGAGEQWVAVDGPYNHHLVGDVGALNLALLAVTLWALVTLDRRLVQVTAVAWLAYGVPHLLYHATHTEPFDAVSLTASLASLAILVAAPVALLAVTARTTSGAALATPQPAPARRS